MAWRLKRRWVAQLSPTRATVRWRTQRFSRPNAANSSDEHAGDTANWLAGGGPGEIAPSSRSGVWRPDLHQQLRARRKHATRPRRGRVSPINPKNQRRQPEELW